MHTRLEQALDNVTVTACTLNDGAIRERLAKKVEVAKLAVRH